MEDLKNQQSGLTTEAAEGLAGAASTIKDQISEKAADVKHKVSELGQQATDRLGDLRETVERYPLQALAAAMVTGFVFGVAFPRRD